MIAGVSDRKTGTDQRPLPARDRGLGRVRLLRGRHARGDVIIVRFADDFTAGFEYQEDAQRFLADLRQRFAKFGLELHPDKTRLIKFGRHAAWRRAERDVGKPETFDFLGFTHLCATTAAVAVCQQPERLICAVAAGRRSARSAGSLFTVTVGGSAERRDARRGTPQAPLGVAFAAGTDAPSAGPVAPRSGPLARSRTSSSPISAATVSGAPCSDNTSVRTIIISSYTTPRGPTGSRSRSFWRATKSTRCITISAVGGTAWSATMRQNPGELIGEFA